MTVPAKWQHRAQQSIAQMPVHLMRTRQPHRSSRDREGVETAPKGFSGIGSECSLTMENYASIDVASRGGPVALAVATCASSANGGWDGDTGVLVWPLAGSGSTRAPAASLVANLQCGPASGPEA
jgi:hypothetical protein